jgi:hypothetical protein
MTVNTLGYAFQGRYVMPLAVGIPLLAAYIIGRNGMISAAHQTSVTRIMIFLLLPFHLFSLGYVMDRWQSGIGQDHSLNPLNGRWHPVTGSALPLLMMTAGLSLLGVLAWRATRPSGVQHVASASGPQAEAGLDHAVKTSQPGSIQPGAAAG